MTDTLSAQDERRALAERLAEAIGRYGKDLKTAWDWNPSAVKDLRVEINYADAKEVLAALRAEPARGEDWNYDMSAAPSGPDVSVLVTVPSLHAGWPPIVGEAWYCADGAGEGWWWSGSSPSDYHSSPIRETNAEPIAWRRLPEPAAIRALPASHEGGGK